MSSLEFRLMSTKLTCRSLLETYTRFLSTLTSNTTSEPCQTIPLSVCLSRLFHRLRQEMAGMVRCLPKWMIFLIRLKMQAQQICSTATDRQVPSIWRKTALRRLSLSQTPRLRAFLEHSRVVMAMDPTVPGPFLDLWRASRQGFSKINLIPSLENL